LPGDDDKGAAQGSVESWSKSVAFLSNALSKNLAAQRELRSRAEALASRAQRSHDRHRRGRSRQRRARARRDRRTTPERTAPRSLDLEYVVPSAGWTPQYDCARAPTRARSRSPIARTCGRRAERIGTRSSSRSPPAPHLGAQGPDPQQIWLRVMEPVQYRACHAREEGWRPIPRTIPSAKGRRGRRRRVFRRSGKPGPVRALPLAAA
jgi:hypothetical protein